MRSLLLFVLASVSACAPSDAPPITALDLVRMWDRAEKRPPAAPFHVVDRTCGNTRLPGIDVPIPSRMIYRLNFPAGARLVTIPILDGPPGAAAEFRIGISDRRTYETLMTRTISAGDCSAGSAMTIDLSGYAGWQWSLFYRPDERVWELILGVTGVVGSPGRASWGAPRIEAHSQGIRRFREQPR